MDSFVNIDSDAYVVKFLEDDSAVVCENKIHDLLNHIFPFEPYKVIYVVVTKEYEEIPF